MMETWYCITYSDQHISVSADRKYYSKWTHDGLRIYRRPCNPLTIDIWVASGILSKLSEDPRRTPDLELRMDEGL